MAEAGLTEGQIERTRSHSVDYDELFKLPYRDERPSDLLLFNQVIRIVALDSDAGRLGPISQAIRQRATKSRYNLGQCRSVSDGVSMAAAGAAAPAPLIRDARVPIGVIGVAAVETAKASLRHFQPFVFGAVDVGAAGQSLGLSLSGERGGGTRGGQGDGKENFGS